MTPESPWPDNRPEFDDLPAWLASALPGRPEIRGPIRVLQVKRWGGTAVFEADGQPVVAKHAQPALFPGAVAVHAAVHRACPDTTAPLLAHGDGLGWQRSVFGFVAGPTAEDAGQHTLASVAEALGQAQAALARTDLAGLPSYRIDDVPDELAEDLAVAGDQDRDVLDEFIAALPVLRRHAGLLAEALPVSIGHPDLNHSNAIVSGTSIVLLDWEEAVVGCPLFLATPLTRGCRRRGNQGTHDRRLPVRVVRRPVARHTATARPGDDRGPAETGHRGPHVRPSAEVPAPAHQPHVTAAHRIAGHVGQRSTCR
ncbi:MAG TPA: hypothetical protein VGD84_10010 [Pseudonocardiaceae bacterium]